MPNKLVVQNIRSDTASQWFSIHNIRQLTKQLKLEPFETGFDSLQIRVWFDYSLAKKKHLIIIENRKNEWRERLYEMNVSYIDKLNYNIIERFTKKGIEPVSGWPHLINALNELKIQDLSDSSQSGTDGTTYCLEILTRESYTYYNFWEPEDTKDSNWQAANMVKILALLEQEFKWKSLRAR